MSSFSDDLHRIRQALKKGLPGIPAQQKLAPQHRLGITPDYLQKNPNYKIACVVLLIYPVQHQTAMVVMERTDFGHHAGQISLPGGKKEHDETFLQAAIRETYEEIGVSIRESDILGPLTEIYIPPSNFLVHPFMAFLETKPEFLINQSEVKRIIEIPLHAFHDAQVLRERVFTNSMGMAVNAPYFEVQDVKIWGATAMIISEFINLL